MSESGFQAGAHEAAQLTNVQLASLEEFRQSAASDLAMVRLRELQDRVDECSERYWKLDKEFRIEQGLRPDVGRRDYSATQVMEAVSQAVSAAIRGKYPIEPQVLSRRMHPGLKLDAASPEELIANAEPLVVDLEDRLAQAEAELREGR